MPLYDYECSASPEPGPQSPHAPTPKPCGAVWEVAQRLEEPLMTHCPTCGQPTAKRVIRRTGGFVLKGQGWAKDGYRTTERGR